MKKLSSPFDLIKKAVTIFAKKENLFFLLKIYVPVAIFSVITVVQSFLPASTRNSNSISLVMILVLLLSLFVGVFIAASGIIALGKAVGGGVLSVKETYKSAWKSYQMFLLLSAALTLVYLLGFILLIIPGILFVVWFAFSRFIVIEKGLGVKQALSGSKELVKGMYWKVLGRLIVFGAFTMIIQMTLSTVPYGVGSIVSTLCGGLFMLPTYLLYKELNA